MSDFEYDVMQKKRVARGAVHRKRGAKSKKCVLPHENLTKKELRALNGEVKTYNIHERMSWKQFKMLPDDLPAKHIHWLVDTFGVNRETIAAALGVSRATFYRYVAENGIQLEYKRFTVTPEWTAFLNGETFAPTGETEEVLVEEDMPVAEPVTTEPASLTFLRGSLSLSGPKGAVLQRLFEVLPDTVTVDVEFTAEVQ